MYIRVDADSEIGAGHIMRCIALGQAWKEQWGEVWFISRSESEALKERVEGEGFGFVVLRQGCLDPCALINTVSILGRKSCDQDNWLVLDGYHFGTDYQKAIREAGIRLLVIDDMNHLSRYHADIILNQNIHASELKYNCDADTALLLGTRYVLLRKEFLRYQSYRREIPERAKNILVTLGGGDPDNVTLKVVEALKLLDESDILVKIIVGPSNPHQETLLKAIASVQFDVEVVANPPIMADVMRWADLAISAGGSTCWELAFMGVPILAVILADNQKLVVEGIEKEGFAVNLGWYKACDEMIMSREISTLIQARDRRLSMIRKGQALIGASGRDHICERILGKSISVRPARESDCELIWYWANDQDVRNSAFRSDKIAFEDHIKWFCSKINDPKSFQFIGYDGRNRAIGQIRFDELSDREYDVDLSIDKSFRGKGHGSQLIRQAIRELLNVTAVDAIHSYVKLGNNASKGVFMCAGFICQEATIIKNTACLHLIWKGK
jgi:UDP-2,4-diacetamido-2,4,6-trideoxy-beta-L-altropyranose hydrolase